MNKKFKKYLTLRWYFYHRLFETVVLTIATIFISIAILVEGSPGSPGSTIKFFAWIIGIVLAVFGGCGRTVWDFFFGTKGKNDIDELEDPTIDIFHDDGYNWHNHH